MTNSWKDKIIIRNKANDKRVGRIDIWGDITSSKWYEEDVTAHEIRSALKELGEIKTLEVSINSYGGEVDAGVLIYNILDEYRKKNNCEIITYNDGICASMASVIFQVGDKRIMRKGAMLMIHKPIGLSIGNADDMRKTAEVLDKYEQRLIEIYMKRFNGSEEKLKEMLKDETWLLADEAVSYKLADETAEEIKVAASANGIIFNGIEFKKDIFKRKDIEDKLKINKESEENYVMAKYNEVLAKYGFDEEAYKSVEDIGTIVEAVVASVQKEVVENKLILTAEAVKERFGRETTSDEILDVLEKYNELKDKAEKYDVIKDKADKFDSIYQASIEEALKSGIRAKGQGKFNAERWRKLLNSMTYEEVLDQTKEWEEEAKQLLNAGKRVSGVESKILIPKDENINF